MRDFQRDHDRLMELLKTLCRAETLVLLNENNATVASHLQGASEAIGRVIHSTIIARDALREETV